MHCSFVMLGTKYWVHACRACLAAEALSSYDGPTAFAIPGNHDWIDGLETFQRFIQHRGWLGGWLLPQVCIMLVSRCSVILACLAIVPPKSP